MGWGDGNGGGWVNALLAIFLFLWGVPVLMLLLAAVFAGLRGFHVVNWNWWWIALPLTIAAVFIAFDEKNGFL